MGLTEFDWILDLDWDWDWIDWIWFIHSGLMFILIRSNPIFLSLLPFFLIFFCFFSSIWIPFEFSFGLLLYTICYLYHIRACQFRFRFRALVGFGANYEGFFFCRSCFIFFSLYLGGFDLRFGFGYSFGSRREDRRGVRS